MRRYLQRYSDVEPFTLTTVASMLLIIVGFIYLIVMIWLVQVTSQILGLAPDNNTITLAGSLIAMVSMYIVFTIHKAL